MAEQFLEEVYSDALILDDLRECVRFLSRYDVRRALRIFNESMAKLQNLLLKYAESDSGEATRLQNIALDIANNWNDQAYVVGTITGKLIPGIYDYMARFTGIEVEDRGYLLKSSDSGFLTIKSADTGRYMHDVHDPMEEAGRVAAAIYDAEMEDIIILGCGLGYLPYKIWKLSDGAVSIVIYEDNSEIIDYARHYGVLDWINQDNLTIRHNPDSDELIGEFLDDIDFNNKSKCIYITAEKKWKFRGRFDGQFDYIVACLQYGWELDDIVKINRWKNKKLPHKSFDLLKKNINSDEWIVLAAGPSFDENLEFIRNSLGLRKIVAVNTVIKRVKNEAIKPDLFVAADSFDQLLEHIDGAEDITEAVPMICDRVTNWKFTYKYRGEIVFISTSSGESMKKENDKDGDSWDVSGTISCMAIEAAARLGAKKIYLVGLDLAFPGGNDYAKGMPHGKLAKSDNTMLVKSVDGGMVETAPTFNSFRQIIEGKIQQYSNIEFINMSKHGAFIKGANVNDY